jgi:hypothetical protein
LAAVGFEAIALALSTPVIGKKKFLAVQALASGLRRLHRFQNEKEPVSETGAKERKKIQPQEESERRRRKKNFQRICRRKSKGRRSRSKPPGLYPFDFALGTLLAMGLPARWNEAVPFSHTPGIVKLWESLQQSWRIYVRLRF